MDICPQLAKLNKVMLTCPGEARPDGQTALYFCHRLTYALWRAPPLGLVWFQASLSWLSLAVLGCVRDVSCTANFHMKHFHSYPNLSCSTSGFVHGGRLTVRTQGPTCWIHRPVLFLIVVGHAHPPQHGTHMAGIDRDLFMHKPTC